ncbi:MAG: MFS transporter [Promethearchaeota archaeon]
MRSLEPPVPLKVKLAFALGGLANGVLSGVVYASITFFYNAKLGLDETLLGYAWLLFMVWNAVNDPILGWLMDNSKSKLGRRVPFIRYGAPLYGLTFALCYLPVAPLNDQTALFVNFLLVMAAFDTMFSLIGTCYFALPNELAITAERRAEVAVFGSVFGLLGILVTFALPTVLLTGYEQGTHPFFLPAMVITGAACAATLWGTSYFLRENKFAVLQEPEGLWESIVNTVKDPEHRRSLIPWMVVSFSMTLLGTILTTGIFYYVDYVVVDQLYLDGGELNLLAVGPLFAAGLLGIAVGIAFNLRALPLWGPKRVMRVNFLLVTGGFLALFATGRQLGASVGPIGVLLFGYSGALVSFPALMGDVIDHDELVTGRRREGTYGGFNAIITKPAVSLANWAFLSVIGAFGFVRPVLENGAAVKQPQPDSAITGILFSLTVIPAFFTALSVVVMRWYDLSGPGWVEKKKAIIALHAKKERDYLEFFRQA